MNRFDVEDESNNLFQCGNGKFIYYEDMLEVIAEAKRDAVVAYDKEVIGNRRDISIENEGSNFDDKGRDFWEVRKQALAKWGIK